MQDTVDGTLEVNAMVVSFDPLLPLAWAVTRKNPIKT